MKLVRTHDDFCLVDALSRQLIPISEYASMYGVKAGVIAEYCKDGRLQGAVSIYGRWFVPCDALYPLDERIRTAVQRVPLPEQLQRLYRCEPKRHAMPVPPAEELRALCQDHSTAEIAEKYGVSATTVSKWLKHAGCELRRKALPMPSAEELRALCQDHTAAEIAEMYGVSATTVGRWRKKAGC